MAKKAQKAAIQQPYIKSDEIRLDTSQAPWMDIAKAEMGKKVRELAANDSFINEMRKELTRSEKLSQEIAALDEKIGSLGKSSQLLGTQSDPYDPSRYKSLFNPGTLPNPAHGALGKMEADRLKEKNPEIVKYFADVKTDPVRDKKGRSWELAPTYEAKGKGEITAWCAAFVNWCLGEAGAPRLGYATADSWLKFGTPVAHPVYGCIVVIKPSKDTGSTTGHVAFYVEHQGTKVMMLGGNQNDRVWIDGYEESRLLGYRWPTKIDHYLLAGNGVVT